MNNSDESIVEQIPASVLDFSSQYGSTRARSYAIKNICKQPSIYPLYGDSTEALVFRTYGPWWINMPSYRETRKHLKRLENAFTSRDFIDVSYNDPVYQCTSLDIYETYNPGSLEVVYLGKEHDDTSITWHRVWKFPEPFSIVLQDGREISIENGRQGLNDLFPGHINAATSALQAMHLNSDYEQVSKISTNHPYPPAARLPRILKIPLQNKVSFSTRHVRLEFDHCTTNYYIEIDSIKLCGKTSKINQSIPTKMISKQDESVSFDLPNILPSIPFDLIFLICSYLDLRSLIQFSSTCQYLRELCLDPLQFKSLNLQPYWNGITNESIQDFFLDHCHKTKYLSLAWTKSIGYESFQSLLSVCSSNLIQLDLGCCSYLDGEYIQTIASLCPNIEILNLEHCSNLRSQDFIPLKDLCRIRTLNVYRTRIDYHTLLPLIDNNKQHLENINLGSCQDLIDTVGIVKLLFAYCCNLRSVDLWRASIITPECFSFLVGLPYNEKEEERRIARIPVEHQEQLAVIYSLIDMPAEICSLTHLNHLSEIDIGWTDPPPNFIKRLVEQAGHSLIKIFLTACRRISNEDIVAIGENCLQLRQLDVLGSNVIQEESIEYILKRCVNIEFIDISFCSKISNEKISIWISRYKNCFKRSYQPISNNDIYTEFD